MAKTEDNGAPRPYYVVVAWEHRPGANAGQIKAADAAMNLALEGLPVALTLERVAVVGLAQLNERQELYGVLNFLASKAHTGVLRYALSPPIAIGASWSGWLPMDRWDGLNAVLRGVDPPEPEPKPKPEPVPEPEPEQDRKPEPEPSPKPNL